MIILLILVILNGFFDKHSNIKLPKNMTMKDIENILLKRNNTGNISLLLSINNKLSAYICLFDSPRPQSKDVINLLQNKLNLKCIMLTGDNHNTAVAVAKCVGIDENNVISQVLPQDKHRIIKQLQLGTLSSSHNKSNKDGYGAIISMQKLNKNKNTNKNKNKYELIEEEEDENENDSKYLY
eukprot:382469_1